MASIVSRALRVSLLSFTILGAWNAPALAQRQSAIGPGVTPLDATGVVGGVDLSASGTTGTLSVGVIGGPAMDIFTLNNPPVAGQVAVSTGASSQGNIVFNSGSTVYGAIGVTQPGGPFLRNISGGNTGTAVNFQGPVFATVTEVVGTGALNFNSGSTNISATNFAADGRISLAPNTSLIGALTTTAGANTGTLSMGGGSLLDGAVGGAIGLRAINVVGGSNIAGVSSTISGAVSAYSFALGTNTLNIGGALTIAGLGPSGVINTTLASPSLYGNIRPVGATNLGPTLLVNVLVPSTAFIPVGTQFNIVQSATGTPQSGTNGSVIAVTVQNPTNPLYTFRAVPAAGTVAGLVTIEVASIPLQAPLAPPPGVVLPPVLPIAAVIVPVLLGLPQTPDILAVLAPINAFNDPALVVDAVARLAPSPSDLAAPLVTFNASRRFQNLIGDRLGGLNCDSSDAIDENRNPQRVDDANCRGQDKKSGWWLNGFGYFAEQDATGSFVGYDADVVGGMIGFDHAIGAATHAGVGIGYARSKVRANAYDGRTDFDTYEATAYIGHEPGPWFANASLSYGINDYETSRTIVFTGVDRAAQADYKGDHISAYATAGYHLMADTIEVTPIASLAYSRVHIDGYRETGAGDVSLDVRSRNYDFLESGLGLKVARAYATGTGTFVPEAHVRWLHDFTNPNLQQTASFVAPGSPSFDAPGFKAGDDTVNVGAGLKLLSLGSGKRTWSLETGYDFYAGDKGYSAHQGTIKLTGRF